MRAYLNRHPFQTMLLAIPIGATVVTAAGVGVIAVLVAFSWLGRVMPGWVHYTGHALGYLFLGVIMLAVTIGAGLWALEHFGVSIDP